MVTVRNFSDAKTQVLHAAGALNPHAATVTDAAFVGQPFFDARDLVQVKYEMVRRVEAEGQSVTQTAATFGFSVLPSTPPRRRWRVAGCPHWCGNGLARGGGTSSAPRLSPHCGKPASTSR
jgi:hypothetical protein